MKVIFVKMIGGEQYTFYRTTREEPVYLVMYGPEKQRQTFTVTKNYKGKWIVQAGNQQEIMELQQNFISAIEENEES